ncbi:cobaltochelatase subunit CobN [Algoriphagus aquimarinus]|uniref:cobaltochelatase subunit CobN n=1 Tax=Algoriphagus aquimarinus TaxID=237018 RepID=UPI0030D7898A|tara:strand:+ start:40781 stop:45499 length:4719 start_codon:yes stop_codon:yes gene_type:complete
MKTSNKKTLIRLILGLLFLIVLGFGYRYYQQNVSPTKVAFINYPEFSLARISKSNTNSSIKLDVLELDKLDVLRDYTAVFIFGRGFQMSPEQMQQLQNAGYAGLQLFVESATNPNVDVTNLKGEDLDRVTEYFSYGGTENYANLLAYVRSKMDGKTWYSDIPSEPIPVPSDVFLHKDEEATFANLEDYQEYLEENGFFKAGQPKVALLTSVPGPFNSNRDHIDSLITMLENRNLNVYTISAATKRLEFLQAIDPDLVILMPHGRLTLGQEKEATAWLKEKNIPLLTPLSVFLPYEDWVDDPQGYSGSLLSMSVVQPELDGGINPYAIIAQYQDESGFLAFKTIPDRLQKFGDMVEKWLALKSKPNKDKKVAIYYFKGPGLNAMVASNMEVVPSIYNSLIRLREEGYTVTGLPDSPDELWEMIKKQGSVLGPYAKGAFDEFLKEGNPALVEKSVYEDWVEKDLEKDSYDAVKAKYGNAPGDYLSTYKDGKDYLAVARLVFGNVVLLPQPLAGVGEDTFKIIHGTKEAPPHPYVASYLWTRNEFKADAIIHWGTHGSLEFTPGKQVALSGYDWADALIGVTPHFYVYTISNVGEGIIAKRRSYATTLTHLTPPFMESEVTGDLKLLSDKLTSFVGSTSAVREQYRKNITEQAKALGLHVDIGLDSIGNFADEDISKLSNHVEEVRNSKVTGGLYSLGVSYSKEQINNTAMLMALDPIAFSLASLDRLKGITTQKQLDDQVYFDRIYRTQAKKAIEDLTHKSILVEYVLSNLLSKEDQDIAEEWIRGSKGLSDSDIIKGFISMGSADKPSGRPGAEKKNQVVTEGDLTELKRLVIAISPFPERVEFIENLKSDKQFKQSSGVLDPQTLEKAKTVAKAIPAMAKAIEVGQQQEVKALLTLMQKESLRAKTFELLEDKSLAQQVIEEKEKADLEIIAILTRHEYRRSIELISGEGRLKEVPEAEISLHLSHLKKYKSSWDLIKEKRPEELKSFWSQENFETKLGETMDQGELILLASQRRQRDHAQAVMAISQAVNSVNQYREQLLSSTESEMQAMLTGLGGGYISPSSGGDPITNPSTIPTGRNLYSIDAEKTPSPEAWAVGVSLAKNLLETHLGKHGEYPKKVSFTLWPGDFIATEGAMVAQIFYLLGVEPVRDPFNRVVDIRLISQQELGRPRIDVLVQTAGQFRDLAASRMYLINKAVIMASEAGDDKDNFVKAGVMASEIFMKEKGLSPKQAKEWSTQRVFGGVNGVYGTNIMGMVERGDSWEDESEVAQTYLNNMGAIYDEGENWGAFQEGVFEAALQNTEVVVQPRESNTWGGLSLDHVYEFMGGLSLAVRHVTGEDPDAYFNDFRNPSQAKVQGLKDAIWVEARSTLLNPKYISEYMKGGATSAEKFAETFRNTYGWNVMKPNEIDNELWDNLHDVYVKDELGLQVHDFFERENPYALEEMTAVMLETIRKGYWDASQQQIEELVNLHTSLIQKYKAGCSEFVCDNEKLRSFISENLTEQALATYEAALKSVREAPSQEDALVLEKETLQKKKQLEGELEDNLPVVLYVVVALIFGLLVFVYIKRRRQE